MIRLTPEFGVEIPPRTPYMDLRTRAEAACNTVNLLKEHGLQMTPCDEDTFVAETILTSFAADPDATSKEMTKERFADLTPSTVLRVHNILDEYGHMAVQNAMRVRYMVQNKLIIESENQDPRIRMKALEMLGKMDDVNMFTEKKEVHSIPHSPEEIESRLKEKLIQLQKGADGVYKPQE